MYQYNYTLETKVCDVGTPISLGSFDSFNDESVYNDGVEKRSPGKYSSFGTSFEVVVIAVVVEIVMDKLNVKRRNDGDTARILLFG